jgi:hypothetical protein
LKWNITKIKFAPGVEEQINFFLSDDEYPEFRKMVGDRIDDILNYPDLFWQVAVIDDANNGHFYTKHQQIELAGQVNRKAGVAVITHFGFHR